MRLTLDTNRLSHPTQRRFNVAWHEMEGQDVRLLPRVAAEAMNRLILPEDLETGRQRLVEDLERMGNRRSRNWRTAVRFALWWADELLSPDSPYHLIEMTPEDEEVVDEVCLAIDPHAFPSVRKENLPNNSDTRIIAEALVTGQRMLITSNMRSVLHHDVNSWAERNAQVFGFRHPDILHVQDEVMPRIYSGNEGRRQLLAFALGAFWPERSDPTIERIERALYGLTEAMARGAQLRETATVIEETWKMEPDPGALLREVRDNLPERMFASERRHPTWAGRMRGETEAQKDPGFRFEPS